MSYLGPDPADTCDHGTPVNQTCDDCLDEMHRDTDHDKAILQQAFDDWRDGVAYYKQTAHRFYLRAYHSPAGRAQIAPWSKFVTRRFPDFQTFYRAYLATTRTTP